MSRRTRKTPHGLKTRFRRPKTDHGPIKRIVGDTPMMTLSDAADESLDKRGLGSDEFDAVVKYAKKVPQAKTPARAAVQNDRRSDEGPAATPTRASGTDRPEARLGPFAEHIVLDAASIGVAKDDYRVIAEHVLDQLAGYRSARAIRPQDVDYLARILQACSQWHGHDTPTCIYGRPK